MLTSKEKDLLIEMLEYCKHLIDKQENSVSDFMSLAHELKEIASAGELYTTNIRFFDVRNSIRLFLKEKKQKANNLINKLIHEQ